MPSHDYGGLAERLETVESSRVHGGFSAERATTNWHRNPDGPEAAAAIRTLTRERDEAVRLLRERDAVVHPHADLVRDIEAFLDRLATVEDKP